MRCGAGPVVLALALTACTATPPAPAGQPSPREQWRMSARVSGLKGVRVTGYSLTDFDEATSLDAGTDARGHAVHCSVIVYADGQGGPDLKVGEKVSTTVQGRPALRSGAGAEGDYLLWQRSDRAWVEVGCDGEDEGALLDRIATGIRNRPVEVHLPFHVRTVPADYAVSLVEADLDAGTANVYLGRVQPDLGSLANPDVLISYDGGFERQGQPVTVAGRPATLDETPTDPGLCLTVETHLVCIGAAPNDSGPRPDRSEELPAIRAIAEGLRFPADLDDRSSWYSANEVFG